MLFQETSDSPHVAAAGGISVSAGGGGNVACSTSAAAAAAAIAASAASTSHGLDQSQTPPPLYQCIYCGHTFQHQSKLTRHILSHSLKTLEYRETAQHPLLHSHLLSHDLNLAQLPQFTTYQMNAAALAASGADTQEQQAAAAVMAAAMELAATCGSVGARSALDLDGSGGRLGHGGGVGGGSATGNSGISGSSAGSGGMVLSGAGSSSSSTSAAAAAAAAAALAASSSTSGSLLGASSSGADPNGVVLCKFCGKSFPDVHVLIGHLPVHTGERPFKCEFCGKAFKLRHHMKDHCRVHTGKYTIYPIYLINAVLAAMHNRSRNESSMEKENLRKRRFFFRKAKSQCRRNRKIKFVTLLGVQKP